jgi:hypothetical protein
VLGASRLAGVCLETEKKHLLPPLKQQTLLPNLITRIGLLASKLWIFCVPGSFLERECVRKLM